LFQIYNHKKFKATKFWRFDTLNVFVCESNTLSQPWRHDGLGARALAGPCRPGGSNLAFHTVWNKRQESLLANQQVRKRVEHMFDKIN